MIPNPDLTSTLSLFELIIGLTCLVDLILSIALAFDYGLDFFSIDPQDPDKQRIRLAGTIGLRNSVSLALISLSFMFYVAVAAFTPPPIRPQNQTAQDINVVIFESVLLILATTASLNLRDRFRIRIGSS